MVSLAFIAEILYNIFLGILFGPWFYLADHIPDIQRVSISPEQLLTSVVVVSVFAILFRTRRLGKEKFLPLYQKTLSRVFYSCVWLALAGSLLNPLVMVANGSRMPTFVEDHYVMYFRNPDRATDNRHILADADTNLVWLSDYIDPKSSAIVDFFYPGPGSYVSPGDLFLAASFTLCWWLLVFILIANIRNRADTPKNH